MNITYLGKNVPILTLQPDWDKVVKSKTDYMTLLFESLDTSEERIARFPRALFGMAYDTLTLSAQETGYIRRIMELPDAVPVGIPFWPDYVELTAGVSIGATSLPVDTTADTAWQVLTGYALIWAAFNRWELVQVSSVGTTSLTLAAATVAAWPSGTRVVPLLFGKLDRSGAKQLNDEIATMSVEFVETFNLLTNQAIKETYPGASTFTYAGQPVFDIRPDFENIEHGQMDDGSYASQGSGLATPWKATSATKRIIKYPFLLEGRGEIKAFRAFVAGREGRRKGFWLPINLDDYRLTKSEAAGASTLTIETIGLAAKYAQGVQYRHLCLLTASTIQCYGILSVVDNGNGTEAVTLDRGLDTALAHTVTVCGPLMYSRFAEDNFDYRFITDRVVQVEVQFIELPTETLTPNAGSGNLGAVHSGFHPVELYKITRAGTNWFYCNYGATITIAGFTWAAANITHGEIRAAMDFVSDGLDLAMATDSSSHPFRYYTDRRGIDITTVTIYEGDADTLTVDLTKPIYAGRVGAVDFGEGGSIRATISSILRISETNVPQIHFQRPCNFRLFDGNCGVVAATYTTSGTVSVITATYVESTAFGAKATAQADANWFALGKVVVGSESRLVLSQSGNRLYLNAPFLSAIVGATVTATPGCDKRNSTCQSKFNNLSRTLQFPYIPNRNPQLKAVEVPKVAGGKK